MPPETVALPVAQHLGPVEALFGVGRITGTTDATEASARVAGWGRGIEVRPVAASLGVLIDVSLGSAILPFHPPSTWGVTTELIVAFASPLPKEGTGLTARAHAVQWDDHSAFSEGMVVDDCGRTIATAMTRLRWVRELPSAPRGAPPLPAEPSDGTAFLDAVALTADAATGTDSVQVEVDARTANPLGNLHGGISLFLCAEAARLASADDGADGAELVPTSLHLTFVRPCRPPGPARFRARVVDRKRTIAVVHVEGIDARGDAFCVAAVTCQIGPAAPSGEVA